MARPVPPARQTDTGRGDPSRDWLGVTKAFALVFPFKDLLGIHELEKKLLDFSYGGLK